MIAGTAILGPVGFVAGSFLGSSAAQQSSVQSAVWDHASENELAKTVDQIGGIHQSLDDLLASSWSSAVITCCGGTVAIALNPEASMVGGVSTSPRPGS